MPPASTSAAPTAEERSQALYDAGVRLYDQGAYDDAARVFRSAYGVSPVPALLYNIAQAERLSGDCAGALRDYRRFQSEHDEPLPPDVPAKIDEMEQCVRSHAITDSSSAVMAVPPVATFATSVDTKRDAAPEPVAAAPRSTHGTRTAIGYGTAAAAVVSAGLGIFYVVQEESYRQQLEDVNRAGGRWGGTYASAEESRRHSRDAAWGFFIASAVFTAASVWLLAVPSGHDENTKRVSLSVDLGPRCAWTSASLIF